MKLYRVKKKTDNKFIIQRKVLGIWFPTKHPIHPTEGDAQTYINLRLTNG